MPNHPDDGARRVRHNAYSLAYAQWFDALPPEEQERLRAMGLDQPQEEQFGPVAREEDSSGDDSRDPSEWMHPVDRFEALPAEDKKEAETEIAKALAWCAQGANIADVGRRLMVVLHAWKPVLIAGAALEIEQELSASFAKEVGDGGPGSGDDAGSVLEWGRRGTSLSQLGQRVLAMVYVICPAAIGGRTLAQLGAPTNKTRQAIDKLVGDFRDTFGGIKNRMMRPDTTRLTCRNSQLARA